jgi:predicted nucleic acid-binding protein
VIRAVLDCNVVVAAMLDPAGQPGRVVGLVREAFELVWSPPIVAECHRVAGHRRLPGRFRVRDGSPAQAFGSSAAAKRRVRTAFSKVARSRSK